MTWSTRYSCTHHRPLKTTRLASLSSRLLGEVGCGWALLPDATSTTFNVTTISVRFIALFPTDDEYEHRVSPLDEFDAFDAPLMSIALR